VAKKCLEDDPTLAKIGERLLVAIICVCVVWTKLCHVCCELSYASIRCLN
jgi:hypothetical protein